jgi:outer membrane lipoprotein-sorting protein
MKHLKLFGLELIAVLLIFSITELFSQNPDATEIVRKADQKMKGEETSVSTMTMRIVRPTWDRTISFKNWTKGTRLSLALITAPAKEKGQTFLKRENEMWNWNPSINRMIKLPPSMLAQGWMGSDFTNDDLLNESSIVVDYEHHLTATEKVEGRDCYKIELTPKEDAPVVWGKILMWISKEEYLQLKAEYYDEDGFLVKTEHGYDVKEIGGRILPSKFELIPADKEGHKTIVTIEDITFNKPIKDSFFSQQNMKRIR